MGRVYGSNCRTGEKPLSAVLATDGACDQSFAGIVPSDGFVVYASEPEFLSRTIFDLSLWIRDTVFGKCRQSRMWSAARRLRL